MASVIFDSGAVGSVINSLLSPDELSRVRIDLTGGTLELRHVYGYADADWSFVRAPGAEQASTLGRNPRTVPAEKSRSNQSDGLDPCQTSTGSDLPSGHGAQIAQLVDDFAHGRTHATSLPSTRPTMEFVTALYASALLGRPVRRDELVPGHPFYADLSGGLSREHIAAAMAIEQAT